ncbi:hypothetical protein [Jannaschia pohangensis]|uniref:DUF541 domain-containing protein n=1 Tax=Jannaschia pohangensis TaxID=390807 RepID=A0A1I3MAP9_9RHOB|nr:hypothetical protein [Jannaschia pohangensis]SFI93786.1 hypothetical protein SAMN04488095_1780 [Jannaschia pohangensis]
MKRLLTQLLNGVAVTSIATAALASGPLSIDPETLGLPTSHSIPVDSGRGSSATILVSLAGLNAEIVDGRIAAEITLALPNLDAALDRLLDTDDFRIKEIFKYRHGDMIHGRADANDPHILRTRFGLRIKNRISRDSHTHHGDIAVTVETDATTVGIDLRLGAKDGFPNWIEKAIQRELNRFATRHALAPELVAAGVRIEDVRFSGAAEDGTLGLRVSVSAPLAFLPKLVAGDLPAADALLVPVAKAPAPARRSQGCDHVIGGGWTCRMEP